MESAKSETIRDVSVDDHLTREQKIAAHAGLVRMVALRLKNGQTDLEDLIQWGQIGLIQAVDRFDPARGTRFSTFAVPYIAGEIHRCLREDRQIHCSRETGRLCGTIHRYQQTFEAEHGRPPSIQELAMALKVSTEKILLALSLTTPVSSIDAPLPGDEEHSLKDTIPQPETGPSTETRLDLATSLSSLPVEEQRLIHLRYYQGLTQTQTAAILHKNQVQVSRLEKKILRALRRKIRG